MDTGKHNAEQHMPARGSIKFSLPAAREVLSALTSFLLGDSEDPRKKAIASSLAEYERQLINIESLYRAQTALALEFGLHGALAEGCADACGNMAELAADPHAVAAALPDVFSVTDFSDFTASNREHIRALSYQANCPQEAVRKEHRAFQKAVADRLRLAAKRVKALGLEPPPLAAADVRTTPTLRGASSSPPPLSSHAAGDLATPLSHQQRQTQQPAVVPVMDERLYCWDEKEDAARKAQLVKLGGLLHPSTGGICKDPISTVGVFQQQMPAWLDWRVRRVALEALSRSGMEVLWRLLQNSKVLDSLHVWLQEAVADQQCTMLKLLLTTMEGLPMPRYLLKGSRLEAALVSLAGGGRPGGAATAAADDGIPNGCMRRRFGAMAAAVLAEWLKDPDQGTILRRAGATVPDAPAAGVAQSTPAASSAAALPIPGSRLLGAAAAKDVMRKRALSMPRALSDGRPAARPRALDASGGGAGGGGASGAPGVVPGGSSGRGALAGPSGASDGTAGSGATAAAQGGPKRPPLASSKPTQPGKAQVDMTAKLGEKGPADPDVVAGFRSRFGDGSVRRSQLARPARGTAAAAPPASAKEPSPGPPPTVHSRARAEASSGRDATTVSELGPEELARLRAERAAQRQATALLALQAEARRHPEVAAADMQHKERLTAKREALRLEAQRRWLPPDEIRRRVQSMRETAPWPGPPPELQLSPDEMLAGTGEESMERLERAREKERVAKMSYPSLDRIPDSPAEPVAPQQLGPPPRAFAWLPSVDTEEGSLDWFRQNRVLWEAGARRAELVLPPALLHKHLDLAPELLPPHLVPPPDAQTAPARALTQHARGATAAAAARQRGLPPSTASDLPAGVGAAADGDWPVLRPPVAPQYLAPLQPPASVPVSVAWERPAEAAPQQLLSEPAPVLLLDVMSAPTPTVMVPLMAMPPAQPLQAGSQAQAPSQPLVYSHGQTQYDHQVGLRSQPQPQPPHSYGHVNGHSTAAPGSTAWSGSDAGERVPYGYPSSGEQQRKREKSPPQYYEQPHHHHRHLPAYQQPEAAQDFHHRHDSHAGFGHGHPSSQNGRGAQHDSQADGDLAPGYGGYQDLHEQERPEYNGRWREPRGYQQPWEYGGRG